MSLSFGPHGTGIGHRQHLPELAALMAPHGAAPSSYLQANVGCRDSDKVVFMVVKTERRCEFEDACARVDVRSAETSSVDGSVQIPCLFQNIEPSGFESLDAMPVVIKVVVLAEEAVSGSG